MKLKTRFFRLWCVNLASIPAFVLGIWVLGIPLGEIWIFLAIALPLFSVFATLCSQAAMSSQISRDGVTSGLPLVGTIRWDEIRSVRRNWPMGVTIRGNGLNAVAIIPSRWFIKNRDEFESTLAEIAGASEAARDVMKIV